MKFLIAIGIIFNVSHVMAFQAGDIFLADGKTKVSLSAIANSLEPGTIVILSEIHNSKEHHDNQNLFLVRLAQANRKISVGMEFFDYTKQNLVDDYLLEKLSEPDFLKQMEWGAEPFDYYRFQVKLPPYVGGRTLALNAPKALTKAIAKDGIQFLPPNLMTLMPPHFSLGNDDYFERFEAVMGGHVSREKLGKYFEAQSTWDETMAWKSVEYLNQNPDQILVIIVGDFHAIYGGGLGERIIARGHNKVITLSQVPISGLTESEVREAVEPHSKYGSRADYIWLSDK